MLETTVVGRARGQKMTAVNRYGFSLDGVAVRGELIKGGSPKDAANVDGPLTIAFAPTATFVAIHVSKGMALVKVRVTTPEVRKHAGLVSGQQVSEAAPRATHGRQADGGRRDLVGALTVLFGSGLPVFRMHLAIVTAMLAGPPIGRHFGLGIVRGHFFIYFTRLD